MSQYIKKGDLCIFNFNDVDLSKLFITYDEVENYLEFVQMPFVIKDIKNNNYIALLSDNSEITIPCRYEVILQKVFKKDIINNNRYKIIDKILNFVDFSLSLGALFFLVSFVYKLFSYGFTLTLIIYNFCWIGLLTTLEIIVRKILYKHVKPLLISNKCNVVSLLEIYDEINIK